MSTATANVVMIEPVSSKKFQVTVSAYGQTFKSSQFYTISQIVVTFNLSLMQINVLLSSYGIKVLTSN